MKIRLVICIAFSAMIVHNALSADPTVIVENQAQDVVTQYTLSVRIEPANLEKTIEFGKRLDLGKLSTLAAIKVKRSGFASTLNPFPWSTLGLDSLKKQAQSHPDAGQVIVPIVTSVGGFVVDETKLEFKSKPSKEELSRALIAAAGTGDERVLLKLLQAGADVNFAHENGVTPLMAAVATNKFHAVNTLLLYKADADKAQLNGCTPLCLLITLPVTINYSMNDKISMAEQLLVAGANPRQNDKNGISPLDRAEKIPKNTALIKLLKEYAGD